LLALPARRPARLHPGHRHVPHRLPLRANGERRRTISPELSNLGDNRVEEISNDRLPSWPVAASPGGSGRRPTSRPAAVLERRRRQEGHPGVRAGHHRRGSPKIGAGFRSEFRISLEDLLVCCLSTRRKELSMDHVSRREAMKLAGTAGAAALAGSAVVAAEQ